MTELNKTFVIQRNDLQVMFDVLLKRGFTPVGPTVRDGAIVYDELNGVADLPEGWGDEQEAGSYRLIKRDDKALFGFNSAAHAWKKYLFPPRTKLWGGDKLADGSFTLNFPPDNTKPFAFIGVRACDLHAIEVQDRIFTHTDHPDPLYTQRRAQALVIVVNCGQAANTCFCTSMHSGPRATKGYDLALTEVLEGEKHFFVAEPGSANGMELLSEIPHTPANTHQIDAAQACTNKAEQQMGREIDLTDIKELLYGNYDNQRWQALEQRCLACGNCTMACPTCFCAKVEDTTDLTGNHAERWRQWDSCFTMDFSYINGGSVRPTIHSRYRQWLVHKLATWLDQFGTSGCVGCGRCITWCPVGIDLTEEVRQIRLSDQSKADADG